MIKLYVLVYQITSEVHQDVDQNVLLAQSVLKTKLALNKNVQILVQEHVV